MNMFNFRSQITQKLLQYFFVNPQEKQYINALARILQVDPGNLDRKLKELEQAGILAHNLQGNQKYYFLNTKYPLLREIQVLFESYYGLPAKLTAILLHITGIQEAYIFGSYAKNTFQMESDIDMIVIGNHSIHDIQKAILPLQHQLQREFNIVNMSPEELKQKKDNNDPFISHIFQNPIIRII